MPTSALALLLIPEFVAVAVDKLEFDDVEVLTKEAEEVLAMTAEVEVVDDKVVAPAETEAEDDEAVGLVGADAKDEESRAPAEAEAKEDEAMAPVEAEDASMIINLLLMNVGIE